MKIAPRSLGLRIALLSVAALVLMAGCTLSGSRGLGEDVTPVTGEGDGTPSGGEGVPAVATTIAPPPTTPAPPAESELSDLEVLGTQAAATATAQAAGGAAGEAGTGETGGEGETGGVTPAAVVTSDLGGEIAPPATTPAPPVTTGSASCPPTHTVAQGDTLYRIALTYGTTYQELATANSVTNPDQISVGQVLNIPSCGGTVSTGGTTTGTAASAGGRTHVVQPGENLFRIALQYDLLWTTLAAANGIDNPNTLVPGQTLQIP